MHPISLQMYTLRAHTQTLSDLEQTLKKLYAVGFRTLQYTVPQSFDVNAVKKLFDDCGMTNDSVFCPSLALEERLTDVLKQCELFETDRIRLDSMPASLASSAAGYKMYAHYLNEVGKAYKQHGKKLLYHFHAFEFQRFYKQCGIDIFLRETDPETVEIIPDTHWIHAGGKNVCDFLETYKDRYQYVHLKDFGIGGRKDILEARPIVFAPVGYGNLNWAPILELCRKNGVKSYAIEQDDCYGEDPFDCVAKSFAFLQKAGL